MSTEVGNKEQSSESSNVVAQGGTVAGMTLFSRITGLVRDMAFSFFFWGYGPGRCFFCRFSNSQFLSESICGRRLYSSVCAGIG